MQFESVLIKTKYCRPDVGPHALTRKRLSEKLDGALRYRLTFVSAPAGYGKTTAVLDWIEKCSVHAAWFSIDPGDDNPIRFWRYFLASLNQAFRNESVDFSDISVSLESVTSNILAGFLINRLYGLSGPVVMVLDDYHFIKSKGVHQSFEYFMIHAPSNFSVIILSRGALDSCFEDLYTRGRILKLDMHDLSFRTEEIFGFFKAKGRVLSPEELSRIEAETEGWAAGLVVAFLTMREEKDGLLPNKILPSFDRHIGNFLKEQIFLQWPDEVKTFLTYTSVPDRFSVSLGQTITGLKNCGEIIKGLLKSNNFLIPLDSKDGWFRYHHLFAEFLKAELLESNPSALPLIWKRAGRWYEANGLYQEAMDAYLAGKDGRRAYALFKKIYQDLCWAGEYLLLYRWMSAIPEKVHKNDVVFCIEIAWFLLLQNRMQEAREWAKKAKASLEQKNDYLFRAGRKNASRALFCLLQANLATLRMDARKTADCFAEACKIPLRESLFLGEINTGQPGILRTCYGFYGRLNKTDEAYSAVAENLSGAIGNFSAYVPMILIESFYERNRLEECREAVAKVFEKVLKLGTSGVLVPCFVILAKLKRAGGDLADAFHVMEEGTKKLSGENRAQWIYLFDLFTADLYIGMKDKKNAEEWMDLNRIGVYDTLSAAREFEHIIFSRYLILAGRLEDAILLLSRLDSFTAQENRLGSRIEVLCLLAETYLLKKNTGKALESLDTALELGMEDGYVRTFLDESEPMAHLLRRYLKRETAGQTAAKRAYAENLLCAMKKEAVPRGGSAAITGTLTHTEKIVLQLLAAERSNAEIAEELGVSVRTVKYHNTNIFNKLGVKSRVEAVYKAKGLL